MNALSAPPQSDHTSQGITQEALILFDLDNHCVKTGLVWERIPPEGFPVTAVPLRLLFMFRHCYVATVRLCWHTTTCCFHRSTQTAGGLRLMSPRTRSPLWTVADSQQLPLWMSLLPFLKVSPLPLLTHPAFPKESSPHEESQLPLFSKHVHRPGEPVERGREPSKPPGHARERRPHRRCGLSHRP